MAGRLRRMHLRLVANDRLAITGMIVVTNQLRLVPKIIESRTSTILVQ